MLAFQSIAQESLPITHTYFAGANWQAVGRYVDVSDELKKFDPPLPPAQASAISSAASPGSNQRLPSGETDAKGAQQVLYA
jgi:hypothetical protein